MSCDPRPATRRAVVVASTSAARRWSNGLTWRGSIGGLVVLLGSGSGQVSAENSKAVAPQLHQSIDREIEALFGDSVHQPSGVVRDEEFVRRVFLDLTGRIPSGQMAKQFLADTTPNKRARLIDRLLTSPDHIRHMQYSFDTLLMQRRPAKHVTADQWQQYLFSAFRQNRGWDQLTREILSADGATDTKRAAARFFLDRQLETDEVTRDIGRVFLGRDLQCAQCHDHPEIGDYLQRHYYGISAFLQRSYLFTDPKSKRVSIGEKAEGTVKFTSVFTSQESQTQPRILDLPEVKDPPAAEDPYEVKPEKATRGIPKYSRRLQLAAALTCDDNRAFRENIANRLWAQLMGRGLVEPLDMFHESNPASHPELLAILADDLLQHGYDLRRLIRGIVLSEAYQRSSLYAAEDQLPHASDYTTALLKPLTPEQLAWSIMQAVGVIDTTRTELLSNADRETAVESSGDDFELEQNIHAELSKHVTVFVEAFASASDSSGFDATASQALFLMNAPLLTKWLEPANGNLAQRALDLGDARAVAREVYLSTLTRLPNEIENQQIVAFLRQFGDDQKSGVQELIRAILCSAEFRFNH